MTKNDQYGFLQRAGVFDQDSESVTAWADRQEVEQRRAWAEEEQTRAVLDAVQAERAVQRGRWGNEHDDSQGEFSWANALGAYVGYVQQAVFARKKAKPTDEAQMRYVGPNDKELRTMLVKLAATAVAWAEVIDRRDYSE